MMHTTMGDTHAGHKYKPRSHLEEQYTWWIVPEVEVPALGNVAMIRRESISTVLYQVQKQSSYETHEILVNSERYGKYESPHNGV